ncbi:hypothetical protein ASPCAL04765 [Aspergillus calidoustus]|uniref:Uncharacterized protein n=1 Tax=Aspergillus calidoustus TaxID=454130 RepID=A0A0U5FY88_ASPCI|nr:hypothetical protein ASPCAL04765 [Aspergillus calidoustus]
MHDCQTLKDLARGHGDGSLYPEYMTVASAVIAVSACARSWTLRAPAPRRLGRDAVGGDDDADDDGDDDDDDAGAENDEEVRDDSVIPAHSIRAPLVGIL